jgi:dipeptidyl aminopeptidase/acylaminoacyl peptidase
MSTLLYCQVRPQSPLTQSYSYRWNFQYMAGHHYIIVAPNCRDMDGHDHKCNEQISKDWGAQVMKDYLTAIDDISDAKYVHKNRLGCVGDSYGGIVCVLSGSHSQQSF